MVARQDMVAVGSLSHVALIDPRKRGTNALITSLASPDVDEGVRSVCLADNLLSFGTGKGKIAFYDIRAAKFLPAGGRQPLRPSTHANPTIETEGAVSPRAQLPFGLDPSRRAAGDEGLPSPREDEYIKVGEGWVERDESYWDYFAGMKVTHACYAHAWDPTGTRLFACGGPLQFGLKGGYCALYE